MTKRAESYPLKRGIQFSMRNDPPSSEFPARMTSVIG